MLGDSNEISVASYCLRPLGDVRLPDGRPVYISAYTAGYFILAALDAIGAT